MHTVFTQPGFYMIEHQYVYNFFYYSSLFAFYAKSFCRHTRCYRYLCNNYACLLETVNYAWHEKQQKQFVQS